MSRTPITNTHARMFFLLVVLTLLFIAQAYHPESSVIAKRAPDGPESANTARVINGAGRDEASEALHLLAGAYYSTREDLRSTLMLNNKGPEPIEVRPTLLSMGGEIREVQSVMVEANSFRLIDMREWAAAAGPGFEEGSLRLLHPGRDLVIGAQMYIVNSGLSLSFEEKLVELPKFTATRLEGVWWLPSPRGDVQLVLSNTAEQPLSVRARLTGEQRPWHEPVTIALSPRETRLVDVRRDLAGGGPEAETHRETARGANGQGPSRTGMVGAVSVDHSGPAGALLARAMVHDARTGYSLTVPFSDPGGGKSSQLHGAGLRLGSVANERLTPIILARNVGNAVTTIRGRVPYTEPDGRSGVVSVPAVRLAPGRATAINLQRALDQGGLPPNVAAAGLEIEYTTPPGSVVVTAHSVSESGNHVFRVPLWDPLAQRSPTGGYPWLLEGDSSTVVYIKNITGRPQQYVAHVGFTGGTYTAGTQTVEPNQTVTIDIRALRDQQVPDVEGRTIPSDVSSGQFHWSMRSATDPSEADEFEKLALIGRSEQVDTAGAVSSSYACQNCCPDSFLFGFTMPSSAQAKYGDTAQFSAKEVLQDCYGTQYSAPVLFPIWSSSNTSVATVDSSGVVTARGEGTATIGAQWGGVWYTPCAPGACESCIASSIAVNTSSSFTGICPVPINFQQGLAFDTDTGVLFFQYLWNSSTGNQADLSQCLVGEFTTYNPAEIPFPSPPFSPIRPVNPTIRNIPGSDPGLEDTHFTPGPFVKPYVAATVTATQIYRYSCPCRNGGAWVTLMGPHSIVRKVSQNPNGTWKFEITKTGLSAKIDPLP